MIKEKLFKIIKNSKDISLLINVNYIIFPFLCPLMIILVLTESYSYSGFLANYILLPLWLLELMFIISGLLTLTPLVSNSTKRLMSNYYRAIFMANKLLFLAVIFEIGLMLGIEKQHFTGYIYTRFLHIEPKILSQVIKLGFVILMIDISTTIFELEKKFRQHLLLPFLIVAFMFWVLVDQFSHIAFDALKQIQFMVAHPKATYAEKMRVRWELYDFWMYIDRNTPESSTIMLPPKMSPWLASGNLGLVRYFLYPRQVVGGKDEYEPPPPEADYATIDWGTWSCNPENCHGWPKFRLEAEWIRYYPQKENEQEIFLENTVYNPEDEINKEAYGIIKIKKER